MPSSGASSEKSNRQKCWFWACQELLFCVSLTLRSCEKVEKSNLTILRKWRHRQIDRRVDWGEFIRPWRRVRVPKKRLQYRYFPVDFCEIFWNTERQCCSRQINTHTWSEFSSWTKVDIDLLCKLMSSQNSVILLSWGLRS